MVLCCSFNWGKKVTKQNCRARQSHCGMWAAFGVWTSCREVFFSPLVFFRGIRDDIEEEDEQVSELSKVFQSRDVLPVSSPIFYSASHFSDSAGCN